MAGKPSVMTPKMIEKFKEAFVMWFSDREACLYCQVNPSTFYEYCSNHKDFAELKELLKEQPKMNAKAVVAKKISEWDDYNSRWYLERKAKDEFSTKSEIDNNTKLEWEVKITKDIKDMTPEEVAAYVKEHLSLQYK